uniref:Nucleotide-binding, alpha-beta plait n=1 Tax=Tanacetum cinerariifolium TaxID=118510 RepID=A0A6L2JFH1_TANCI|nr:nucleotide-binding, alpha-beta plait [Tanacetum cinerariifolium]
MFNCTQFKVIVEYAPSQRVPKQWSKKDGREGTIGKDPEYLEFLEFVSKPVENLPSAEIQLERKEAERAGAAKEAPIVTPLMDFIRQKRAAKGVPRRPLPNGKLLRRAGASSSSSSSTVVRRGSEKRTPSTMYVQRDSGKSTNVKEKSSYVKRDGQVSDKSRIVAPEEERALFGASCTLDVIT